MTTVDTKTGEILEPAPLVPAERRDLTIAEVRQNLSRVQALLRDVMIGPSKDAAGKDKPGVHYGVIPGTKKPTLLQPGAELIFMMFRLEGFPIVEDLSTADVIRYRVKIQVKHQLSGLTLGWGIGECSSDEEKYRWRRVVCQQEYDEADPALRRKAWKKGSKNSLYQAVQVRTHPADVANTILKMAEKRAKVAAARGTTAASDVFEQDVEDLSPEQRAEIYGDDAADTAGEHKEPGELKQQAEDAKTTDAFSGKAITEAQQRILRTRLETAGLAEADLTKEFKVAMLSELPIELINRAMAWISTKMK